jgi:FkbM family methyltransferase
MPTKPDFGPYKNADEIPEEERKYYYIMDKFRPADSIEFVEIKFNEIWPVKIPRFLYEYHSWWDYWERDCHLSMQANLKPGMLLYDVGAFDGWQSAVFSQMVGGPENMVLIEPVPEMWANTKLTWDKNVLAPPKASFVGFAANYDKDPKLWVNTWPTDLDYSQILKAIKFRLLHEHADHTPAIMIDTIGDSIDPPDALHIDVEGAELEVLRGAYHTLKIKRPLVWIAVHPQFMQDRFQTVPDELAWYMNNLNYTGKLLATDHEEHWFWEPKE